MGNADSGLTARGGAPDSDDDDLESQKSDSHAGRLAAGEAETKGTPATSRGPSRASSRATASRPTTAASRGMHDVYSGSFSDSSEEELDDEEVARRRALDFREYEYDPEQVEELIMLSGMTEAEVGKLFKRFFAATKMSKNPSLMRRSVFLSLPEIAVNPLKHRIAHVFGFNEPHHRDGINFGTFVQKLALFSEKSSTGDKMRASFDMYDLDNTGKISRDNMRDIISLCVELGEPQTEAQRDEHERLIASAIDKVFQEASSDKDLQYIDFSDYRAILLQCSDFQAKFILRLV